MTISTTSSKCFVIKYSEACLRSIISNNLLCLQVRAVYYQKGIANRKKDIIVVKAVNRKNHLKCFRNKNKPRSCTSRTMRSACDHNVA